MSHFRNNKIKYSCDDVAKSNKVFFLGPGILGLLAYIMINLLNDDCHSEWAGNWVGVLYIFDLVTLPRSFLELDKIFRDRGVRYYEVATCMEALSSLISLAIIIFLLRNIKAISFEIRTSSLKKVIAAVIICLGTLLFRPIDNYSTSIMYNRADIYGFYFIREGILISIGYYNLYYIFLNLCVSYRKDKNRNLTEYDHG